MNKRVTVRVPDELLAAVEARVEAGEYASQSAAIRAGLREIVEPADQRLRVDGGHHDTQSEGERQ